jgi:NAD(P)-dependent dehydrogenase (short-subunit alcohol dehydrogenase family)
MSTHLYIITGASKGMGLEMAKQLLDPTHHLLCISRHVSATLDQASQQQMAPLTQWTEDLSEPAPVADRLRHWLESQASPDIASATLINNAGVIPAITPLRDSDLHGLAQALRVGLEAPLLLSSAFLRATRSWSAMRKVLNISSGLGRRPMASQSAYCAAKAGLDHFTRCMALDEALTVNGAKVCSLAPGVIDTDMQGQLRGATPDSFPDQASFAQLKDTGQLTSAHDAATRVLAWLKRPDFGNLPVDDVRR